MDAFSVQRIFDELETGQETHLTVGGRCELGFTKLATWREKTQGWGLINIQITDQPEAVSKCSVSVNSQKRAHAWAETLKELGDPERWDWKVVDSQASRIIRVLRRLS